MDCIKNDWTDSLFKENAYQFETDPIDENNEDATKVLIIAELERMGTDTARALIAEMNGKSV